MSDEGQINIDLDPKKVMGAIDDMGKEFKLLATRIDEALGRDAAKNIGKFEKDVENGTNKVSKFFRNLGNRIKEDLKTAFDVGALASGLKIGQQFAEGTKQVFEMERAFDRLNTRLQLTGKQLSDFKKELGRKVSATGQKLEDILPGVETVAARGNVKSPEELAQVGDVLSKVRATTSENTETLADTVVEILKNQGEKVTASSFKSTIDALQGTRTAGAFKSAGEAGNAVNDLAPYGKKLGLSTRDLGGLAAQASKSGPQGLDILKQLLEKGTTIGGQEQINAALGQKVFQKGKLNTEALGQVDEKRFGKFSQQILQETTGLTGANGGDLVRFLSNFKGSLDQMKKVTSGSEETSSQFDAATDNLATSFDKFKQNSVEAGREIGTTISKLGGDILKGRFGQVFDDLKDTGKAVLDNKGTVAGGLGLATLGALLTGGATKKLLKKGGGLVGGLAGAEAAKAVGIQPVYVTNASEIGRGSEALGASGIAQKLKNLLPAGLATQSLGASSVGQIAGAAGIGGAIGVAIGEVLLAIFPRLGEVVGESIYEALHGSDKEIVNKASASQSEKMRASFNERNGTTLSSDEYAKAVESGTLKALKAANKGKTTHFTNPSAVHGRGRQM